MLVSCWEVGIEEEGRGQERWWEGNGSLDMELKQPFHPHSDSPVNEEGAIMGQATSD